MGAHPWFYTIDYDPDINAALQRLREREFRAGRYNPRMPFPPFPVESNSPAPGPGHGSIDEALEAADADGTRSILDMMRVSQEADLMVVSPLSEDQLLDLFGTLQPNRGMVEACEELFESLDRGQGVYIVLYDGEAPAGIFFAGYSFD